MIVLYIGHFLIKINISLIKNILNEEEEEDKKVL